METDRPHGAVRVTKSRDRAPHELVRLVTHDLADSSPAEDAGAVASSEPRTGHRRVRLAYPFCVNALMAPLTDARRIANDVPHRIDVCVDVDRAHPVQLHTAWWPVLLLLRARAHVPSL